MAFPLHLTFGNNKNKKPKQPQSLKQKTEKLEYAEKKAKAQVKVTGFLEAMKDPALQQQFIAKEYNLTIPQVNLVDKKRAEIMEQALGTIDFEADDDLRAQRDEWVSSQLFQHEPDGKGQRRSRRDRDYDGGGVSRVVQDIEALREASELLGFREKQNSWLSDLAPAIPAVLQLLAGQQGLAPPPQLTEQTPRALPLGQGQAQPLARVVPVKAETIIKEVPTYLVIMPDGSPRKLTEAEFQQMMQPKPKPAQEAPAQQVQEQPRQQQPQPEERSPYTMGVRMPETATPEEKPVSRSEPSRSYVINVAEADLHLEGDHSLGLESWLPYLDRDPTEFVEEIQQRSYTDAGFKFLLDTLRSTANAAALLSTLAQFKGDPKYGPIIAQLEKKREWVEAVIAYAKESSGI